MTTGSEAADSCKTNMCLGGVPVASKIPTQWKRLRKGPSDSHASGGEHGVEFGPARDIFSEIVSCIFNSFLKYPGDYFKQLLRRCPHLMVGHRNQGEARSRKTVSEAASGPSLIPPFGACSLLGTFTNETECHSCYGNTQEVSHLVTLPIHVSTPNAPGLTIQPQMLQVLRYNLYTIP